MEDSDGLLFNVASFVSGLFLLEYGADKFIDHTAIVAKRLNVSPTLIGLLTCGAEWEELVVVIVALGQGQPSLALGNVMGSSIANILASFSLGLLFIRNATFDRSSKIYTTALLVLTSVFLIFLFMLSATMKWFAGLFLILLFAGYVASVASLIYKGTLTAPENDSSDDSSDSIDSSDESGSEGRDVRRGGSPRARRPRKVAIGYRPPKSQKRSLWYHVLMLTIGLGALLVASYIVAHSAGVIGTALGLSRTVIGTTILSLATTLPEKFVAVLGGVRKQPGIMVANTVGSNIFLLTLCAGLLFLCGDAEELELGFTAFEALVMWVAAVLIFVVVWTGGKGWMGGIFIGMYVTFLMIELTHGRKLDDD